MDRASFTDLRDFAVWLGVEVMMGPLTPYGLRGHYNHYKREIILNMGMSTEETLATFAHELGHAIFGHVTTTVETEREANDFAWHMFGWIPSGATLSSAPQLQVAK